MAAVLAVYVTVRGSRQACHLSLAPLMLIRPFDPDCRLVHTSGCLLKNRAKDRALVQHLHYRDHEKTLRHRNLPLVELPDYSYTDGRPTEIALGQKQRQDKNIELARQVVKLVGEMKFAQEQHISQQNAKTEREQQRLDSRLKDKGHQT